MLFRQGLILVHLSAEPELCLTLKQPSVSVKTCVRYAEKWTKHPTKSAYVMLKTRRGKPLYSGDLSTYSARMRRKQGLTVVHLSDQAETFSVIMKH